MKYIKHSITISLSKPHTNGACSVLLRVSTGGMRDNLHTGITVQPKQWDGKNSKIKHGCVVDGTPYNILNESIEEQITFVHTYFNDCSMRGVNATLADLKSRFNHEYKMSTAKGSDEFFYLYDRYISETATTKQWQTEMKEVVIRTKEQIKAYNPDITFSSLTTETMNGIVKHLSATMYNDALLKRLTYFKSFIKWAEARGYRPHPEYALYSPKLPTAKKEVRYLTINELNQIRNCDKIEPGSALDQTRDLFLFQCNTAFRYSDLRQLTHDNIITRDDGSYEVRKLTEKDDDYIQFKLTKTATDIYLKYKDNVYDNNALFPVISNQKYNDHLKELGNIAGLSGDWIDYEYRLDQKIACKTPKKNLSSHTARRTFVVIALNEGISTDLIGLITSHSDVKSMAPYIKMSARGKDKVIEALDKAQEQNNSNE